MKTRQLCLLIAAMAALSSPSTNAAGFKLLQVPDSNHKELTVGLWYPSDVAPPTEPNTEFNMAVAMDAPVGQANGGLIVVSHGFGGWYAGHADTAAALADAGYVVAAPSHTGNTWSDMSSSIDQWVLDRPRHISRVIDHVQADESVGSHLSPEKIGVYGFSAGGYTAIGLIGGVPDFEAANRHCSEHPTEFVCTEGMVDGLLSANMGELPADAWGADQRIKAAVISAPGLAFAYPKASLTQVTADVQLWSAQLDDSVPTDTNAALLAAALPSKPEQHWVENANHFAFMIVACRDAFKKADPKGYAEVCADMPEFDRYAFHEEMHTEMVRFFDNSLNMR